MELSYIDNTPQTTKFYGNESKNILKVNLYMIVMDGIIFSTAGLAYLAIN